MRGPASLRSTGAQFQKSRKLSVGSRVSSWVKEPVLWAGIAVVAIILFTQPCLPGLQCGPFPYNDPSPSENHTSPNQESSHVPANRSDWALVDHVFSDASQKWAIGGLESLEENLSRFEVKFRGTMITVLMDDGPEKEISSKNRTPTLRAGYAHQTGPLSGVGDIPKDALKDVPVPTTITQDKILLGGLWKSNPDSFEHRGDGKGIIIVGFFGSNVSMTASSPKGIAKTLVFLDGAFLTGDHSGADVRFNGVASSVAVSVEKEYRIMSGLSPGRHLLVLVTENDGFSLKKFNFQ